MLKKYCLVILLKLLLFANLSAQTLTSDENFQMARKEAFDHKNYDAAIRLCKQALQQTPDYPDIQVFLGRVYYWNKQPDSSLQMLKGALETNPAHEDASIAITIYNNLY